MVYFWFCYYLGLVGRWGLAGALSVVTFFSVLAFIVAAVWFVFEFIKGSVGFIRP